MSRARGLTARRGLVVVVVAAASALASAASSPGAGSPLGSGIGPWRLGQAYAKRSGLVHSETFPTNTGPGCVGGPAQASRVDYYRTIRTAWRRTSRKHLYLIDVATTAAGDRSKEGFVVGSSHLASVRRRHPDIPLGYASDRLALGTRSITVTRRSSKETFVSLVYWFDARGVLNAFELFTSGC